MKMLGMGENERPFYFNDLKKYYAVLVAGGGRSKNNIMQFQLHEEGAPDGVEMLEKLCLAFR